LGTGGTTDKDDFMDVGLVDLGVPEDLLDGLKGATDPVLVRLLETGTSERGVEVDTLDKRANLNRSLSSRRESGLRTLASRP